MGDHATAAAADAMSALQLDAAFAKALAECRPDVALVLGSGLASLVHRIDVCQSVPYAQVRGLAAPSVENHRGVMTLGDWAGKRLLVFEGRLHFYEGHPWPRVEMSVQLAAQLGVRQILLTNASGGIRGDLPPGSFLAIRDHIEWNRPYCWRSPGPGGLGDARQSPYSPRLLQLLEEAAVVAGVPLFQGIYAAVTGPSYETPAEIRALKACGADAVGMSTTREAARAHALGLECAAVSCVTNHAAGLGDGPISHEEVLTTAATQGQQLADLIEAFLRLL
jgi:purine-nucleoside phosphorylase